MGGSSVPKGSKLQRLARASLGFPAFQCFGTFVEFLQVYSGFGGNSLQKYMYVDYIL